jgi:hypothetical protein
VTATRTYTAVAYLTTTGRITHEIDLVEAPTWDALLNDAGTWQVKVQIGHKPGATAKVREWATPMVYSVAILLGDTVCQAGPITSYAPDDGDATVTVSGKGVWEALSKRLLHNKNWNPAVKPITDVSANLTFTDSLWNIAQAIVGHSTTWVYRAGSVLPVDVPVTDPAGGSAKRTYFGYDLASTGQRLQELTQDEGGPDVYFQPYIVVLGSSRVIRHRMLIGTPTLTQPGVPLLFDYNSNLQKLSPTGDASTLATTAWVKGTGSQDGQLYGYATAQALLDAGYPAVDFVDSEHTDSPSQPALNGWANADIALYGSAQLEQWKATVDADAGPPWGEYIPGHFANYAVQDHNWLEDGLYLLRILGVSGSAQNPPGTVDHVIQGVRM